MEQLMKIRNQDGKVVFIGVKQKCVAWIMEATLEARTAIGSSASDEDWLATLLDNGFYSIEEAKQ